MGWKSLAARLERPRPGKGAGPAKGRGGNGGEEWVYFASQWQLVWWRFRRHRLAMAGGAIVALLYVVAILADVVAPYDIDRNDAQRSYQPPSTIRFVDAEGRFHLRPFIYGITQKRDLQTLALVFSEDTGRIYPIHLFVHGLPYKLLGIIPTDVHLVGLESQDEMLLLFGADHRGRDAFSRVVHGARVSLSIGLVGVLVSFVLGIFFGGISGYFGGAVDVLIQRAIEFLRSMPTIPLWMGLSAALPPQWPIMRVYFGITIILSLIGWTELARVVRGRFLSLREEDYILAARLDGCKRMYIIFRHMVPSFASHIIAALTLAVPTMILSETALSFLGLGLRYPAVSWGVLLQDAQNIRSVALAPWLLTPGVAVVIAVLSMNFLGDGLRDAADPYAT